MVERIMNDVSVLRAKAFSIPRVWITTVATASRLRVIEVNLVARVLAVIEARVA
jgi:hypothetical protein